MGSSVFNAVWSTADDEIVCFHDGQLIQVPDSQVPDSQVPDSQVPDSYQV